MLFIRDALNFSWIPMLRSDTPAQCMRTSFHGYSLVGMTLSNLLRAVTPWPTLPPQILKCEGVTLRPDPYWRFTPLPLNPSTARPCLSTNCLNGDCCQPLMDNRLRHLDIHQAFLHFHKNKICISISSFMHIQVCDSFHIKLYGYLFYVACGYLSELCMHSIHWSLL